MKKYNELWAKCMGGVEIRGTFCIRDKNGKWQPLLKRNTKFDPVNDMSQCWLLVEKMEVATGFQLDGYSNYWEFSIWGEVDGVEFWHADADTPQKAIILACAKAKGLIE